MPDLGQCPFCEGEISTTAKKCRHCGESVSEMDTAAAPPKSAKIEKRTETTGDGCMIQGIGLVGGVVLMIALGLTAGWMVGPAFTIALLIWGHQRSFKWVCGNCGNRVMDKQVKMCPTCRFHLRRP